MQHYFCTISPSLHYFGICSLFQKCLCNLPQLQWAGASPGAHLDDQIFISSKLLQSRDCRNMRKRLLWQQKVFWVIVKAKVRVKCGSTTSKVRETARVVQKKKKRRRERKSSSPSFVLHTSACPCTPHISAVRWNWMKQWNQPLGMTVSCSNTWNKCSKSAC